MDQALYKSSTFKHTMDKTLAGIKDDIFEKRQDSSMRILF
jgi:hypothetical protein